jgi:hypothetical protein
LSTTPPVPCCWSGQISHRVSRQFHHHRGDHSRLGPRLNFGPSRPKPPEPLVRAGSPGFVPLCGPERAGSERSRPGGDLDSAGIRESGPILAVVGRYRAPCLMRSTFVTSRPRQTLQASGSPERCGVGGGCRRRCSRRGAPARPSRCRRPRGRRARRAACH